MTARDLDAMARKLLDKLDLEPNVANLDDAYHALASARAEGAGKERDRVVGLLEARASRDTALASVKTGELVELFEAADAALAASEADGRFVGDDRARMARALDRAQSILWPAGLTSSSDTPKQ